MAEPWRERLADHWRTLTFVLVGLVVATIGFVFGGPFAGSTALFTVFAGVLSRQPSHRSPRPRLGLSVTRQIDLHPSRAVTAIFTEVSGEKPAISGPAEERRGAAAFGARRDLDHQAIWEDAVTRAKAAAPREGYFGSVLLGAMGQFAKPTEEDHEEFAQRVDAYGGEVKDWLEKISEAVKAEMAVLVASVQLTNPAKVDATEARVILRFSGGFTMAPAIHKLEEPPPVPKFPFRRSRLAPPMSGFGLGPDYPPMPMIAAQTRTKFDMSQFSPGAPDYEEDDGMLVVSYPRRTIRHGETGTAGDDLRVRGTETGEHDIVWEIHASNLENAATGTFTVINCEELGEPVRTLGELEHLLVELGLASDDEE